MTALALAVLLVAFSEAVPDSADAPCTGGAVVTRADIEAAGAITISEVLDLAGALDHVTVDGFDLQPVASVGIPFAEPVRVLVDGAPVALGAGPEPPGLAALPVALGEVERVVVCPGLGVAGGAFGGPWIDVQTAPPARSLYGAYSLGNEAGDPGPARYLDPTLPNVDRWGPDVEGAAGLRLGEGAVWASARRQKMHPTDPAMLDRTTAASSRYPKRNAVVAATAGRAAGLRVRLGVRTAEDLPFVPEAGTEVPLDHASVQATVAGDRAVGRLRLGGHLHAARLRLERPDWSRLDADPSWTETRLDAALTAAAGAWAGGVRLDLAEAEGAGLTDGSVVHASGWGRTDHAGWRITASASGAGSGLGGGIQVERPLGSRIMLSAAASRTLPEAARDLGLWGARGADGIARTARVDTPADVGLVRLGVSNRLGAVRLRASAEVQAAEGRLRLAEPDALGSVYATSGGAVLSRAEAVWQRRGLRVRASARAQGAVWGAAAYRRAWRRLPRLGGALDATLRPDDRLALWARLTLRSGSRWDAFPEADLPAAALLDLGLSRRAWGERLRLALGGRNVLGAEERMHPLGAPLAPRLFVRLEARL
ncbi:MAG: hypothetical protein AAF594_05445 [Bacteroidota bacterium]